MQCRHDNFSGIESIWSWYICTFVTIKLWFKGTLMTVIYVMFLVSIIVSLVLVLDQLQGKNLKKQSYLSKKSRIEENA
jgi:hypothetical protein